MARRKRRGQIIEATEKSVNNAVFNVPPVNKTKPVASLFSSKKFNKGIGTMSYQLLGDEKNLQSISMGPGKRFGGKSTQVINSTDYQGRAGKSLNLSKK